MKGGKDGTGQGHSYSFGWWPKNRVPSLASAILGVSGELNGMYDGSGTKIGKWDEDHDTHEGDMKGKVFAAKVVHDLLQLKRLKYGIGKGTRCCKLDPTNVLDRLLIADCVLDATRDFATTETVWKYPGKWNCHSFQRWLLDQCCICKPGLFTKAEKDYDADQGDDDETEPDSGDNA